MGLEVGRPIQSIIVISEAHVRIESNKMIFNTVKFRSYSMDSRSKNEKISNFIELTTQQKKYPICQSRKL